MFQAPTKYATTPHLLRSVLASLLAILLATGGALFVYHGHGVWQSVSTHVEHEHRTARWIKDNCDATLEYNHAHPDEPPRHYPTARCVEAEEQLRRNKHQEIIDKVIEEHLDHIPVLGYCRSHEICGVLLTQLVGSISNSLLWICLAFLGGLVAAYFVQRSWTQTRTSLHLASSMDLLSRPLRASQAKETAKSV